LSAEANIKTLEQNGFASTIARLIVNRETQPAFLAMRLLLIFLFELFPWWIV